MEPWHGNLFLFTLEGWSRGEVPIFDLCHFGSQNDLRGYGRCAFAGPLAPAINRSGKQHR
jgi:hypothetical protein